MNKSIQLFVTIVSVICLATTASSLQDWLMCTSDGVDFDRFCTDTRNGVVINNRCFFIPSERVEFDGGWDLCQTYNATLAQIHTNAEYTAIVSIVPNTYTDGKYYLYPFIALRRDTTCSGSELSCTYWYSGPTEKLTNLPSEVTFIQNRQHLNDDLGNEYCYVIRGYAKPVLVNDAECNATQHTLCQITNAELTFKLVPDVCVVNQGLITEMKVTNVDECASACHSSLPCRSFNYFSNKNCQLLTWSSVDLTTDKDPIAGCFHYE